MPHQIHVAGDHLKSLANLSTAIHLDDLPPAVVHTGRRILIDSIAVMLAGMDQPPVTHLAEQLAADSTCPDSTIPGTRFRCDAAWAALANATAAAWHGLAPGNRFTGGNPAIHAVCAGLAVAERENLSGKQLLTAIIAGCEAGTRVGMGTTLRPGMYPNGSWTVVGAAITASLLMNHSQEQLRQAINVSTSLNVATSCKAAYEGATILNAYSGVSAAMGVLAADLVGDGFTAERDGIGTVFGTIAGVFFDTERAIEQIGKSWQITRGFHTTYACDRRIHAILDALIDFSAEQDLAPESIDGIEVHTYASAATLNKSQPGHPSAAKLSIPHAVAAYLVLKDAGISAYSRAAVQDPAIRDLAGRVTVREDPDLTARTPDERPARVSVKLRSGKKRIRSVVLPSGEFDNAPLGDDQLSEKFRVLSTQTLPPGESADMLEKLWHVETAPNVAELIAPAHRQTCN